MSIFNKEIISEKTIIIWIVLSALIGIVCTIIESIFIKFTYGCWPMGDVVTNHCLDNIDSNFLLILPMIISFVAATFLTVIIIRKEKNVDK